MSYLNGRGKSFGVAIIFSLFFAIFSLSTFLGTFLPGDSWIYGTVLVLLAIPTAILGGKYKPLYIATILFNSIGTGFIAAFYYSSFSIALTIADVLPPFLVGVAMLSLFSIASHFVTEGRVLLFAGYAILLVLLLVTVAILWGVFGDAFYSMLFFISILLAISTVLLAVTTAGKDENELLRDASYASFGILVTVGVIVAVLVSGDGCDCDGCDLCDCGDLGGKKRKKGIDALPHDIET